MRILVLVSAISLFFIGFGNGQQVKSVSLSGPILGFDPNEDNFYAAVPLKQIEAQVRNDIEQSLFEVRWGGRITLTPFSFNSGPVPTSLSIQVGLDTGLGGCKAAFSMFMHRAKIRDFEISPSTPSLNCKLPSFPGSGDLERSLEKSLLKELRLALAPKILGIPKPDSGSADLDALLESLELQGGTCIEFNQPFLCFQIFLPNGTINALTDLASQAAPPSEGPLTQDDIDQLRSLRETLLNGTPRAPLKSSYQFTGFSFPAKFKGHTYDDGDAAIFNGLLCASGQRISCDAISRMQSSSGQIWRSPDRRNSAADQAQFSGDQFLGVLLYLTQVQDKDLLAKWLSFLSSNSKPLPDNAMPMGIGYKSCVLEGRSTNNCLLGGFEWNWLRHFANKFGMANALPIKQTDPEQIYGYSTQALPLLAASADVGPALHLIGIQLYLHKQAGLPWNDTLQKSANILVLRQTENAFFRFLSHGQSHDTAQKVLNACKTHTADNLGEWIWERAQSSDDWKHSMMWDCVFIINALIGPSPSTAPTPPGPNADTINQLIFLTEQPSAQQCTSTAPSEAYAISENRIDDEPAIRGPRIAGSVKIGSEFIGHKWTLRDTDYTLADAGPILTPPFAFGRPYFISADGRAYLTAPRAGGPTRVGQIAYQDGKVRPLPALHDGIELEEALLAVSVGNAEVESSFTQLVGTLRKPYNQRDRPPSVSRLMFLRKKDERGATVEFKKYQPLRLNQPNPANSPLSVVAVSADAQHIFANSRAGAYLWTETQGWRPSPGTDDGLFEVAAVSANGSHIVGYGRTAAGPAIVVSTSGGSILRTWPASNVLQKDFKVVAISSDRKTMIGNKLVGGVTDTAYIWKSVSGWSTLEAAIQADGTSVPPGTRFLSVNAMSIDGRSFVGAASYNASNCAKAAYFVRLKP